MDESFALRPPSARSALVTGLLGWIVPGLGHVYVGRPGKALLYFIIVVGTYALGLRFGEFLCVHRDREPYWFLGQALAGGPTAAILHLTRDFEIAHRVAFYDLGLLYTTAAGLLNAVAVADALGVTDDRRTARAHALAESRLGGLGAQPIPLDERDGRIAAEHDATSDARTDARTHEIEEPRT